MFPIRFFSESFFPKSALPFGFFVISTKKIVYSSDKSPVVISPQKSIIKIGMFIPRIDIFLRKEVLK